eukprot:7385127-Prymnesium_polylepis.5
MARSFTGRGAHATASSCRAGSRALSQHSRQESAAAQACPTFRRPDPNTSLVRLSPLRSLCCSLPCFAPSLSASHCFAHSAAAASLTPAL